LAGWRFKSRRVNTAFEGKLLMSDKYSRQWPARQAELEHGRSLFARFGTNEIGCVFFILRTTCFRRGRRRCVARARWVLVRWGRGC
jgi:hypothetical protein